MRNLEGKLKNSKVWFQKKKRYIYLSNKDTK